MQLWTRDKARVTGRFAVTGQAAGRGEGAYILPTGHTYARTSMYSELS
jgi:hypothetical protein